MSFSDKIESANETQGLGNIADQDSFFVLTRMAEGDVDAQLYDRGIGYILTSLLGAVPVTSGSNPYTHVFSLSQSNLAKTLTLYWKDPDRSYAFPNSVVDSWKVSVAPNGLVEFTTHFKAKGADDFLGQTPDYTTVGSKFTHQHLQFRLAANIAGLAAAVPISLKNFEINFNRNAIFDTVIGTAEPEDILSKELSIEGSLNLNLEDDVYRNYMLAGTYKSMEIKLFASASSSLTIQLPRVSFSEWEPDFALNDIAKQKINFKANYDAANALQIVSTATLINTKVSY
jgi:hypothetical protein